MGKQRVPFGPSDVRALWRLAIWKTVSAALLVVTATWGSSFRTWAWVLAAVFGGFAVLYWVLYLRARREQS